MISNLPESIEKCLDKILKTSSSEDEQNIGKNELKKILE